MQYFLIIGTFEALFLSLLLFLKKNRNCSDTILSAFFFLFGINILLSYIEFYNRKNGYPFPEFINTTAPFILLHGPVMWLYIKSQTIQNFKIKFSYLIHLLPFFIMVINHFINFYVLSDEEIIKIAETESFKDYMSYKIFVIMIALSPAFYFSWGIVLINNYNKKIRNYLSQTEHYDFGWLKKILIGIIIVYCLINSIFVIDLVIPLASFKVLQSMAFLLASLFILFIGIYGHRQNNLFSSEKVEASIIDYKIDDYKYFKSNKTQEHFLSKLKEYMKTHKPYTDPELSISKLSKQLNVASEYLSTVLNKELDKNFFDYINSYRIEEFKQQVKLPENQKLTLIGIALNCGFNSKATFNRVFKNAMNITPSRYKQSISEK